MPLTVAPQLSVRRATTADIEEILAVIDAARIIMRATGNLTQWPEGYPGRHAFEADIAAGHCYIVADADGHTSGCFSFIPGPDPTYAEIYGRWTNDRPYYVIHRLASSGRVRGVARACLDFCRNHSSVIRIDTHADNIPMRNWLKKEHFIHCGVIRLADGSPREAYLIECHPSQSGKQ